MLLAGVLLMSIAAATPAPAPCSDAAWRQFDFWLGEWDVRGNDAAAQLKGRNTILRVDGCALLEEWVGAKGTTGHSLNVYDGTDGKWHQFWVDSTGSVLRLSGRLVGDEMVMTGVSPSGNGGAAQQQRITWSPRPDGSVRQHWESSDDGRDWTTAFDGIYRHRSP
jgi:hypothetical protein